MNDRCSRDVVHPQGLGLRIKTPRVCIKNSWFDDSEDTWGSGSARSLLLETKTIKLYHKVYLIMWTLLGAVRSST